MMNALSLTFVEDFVKPAYLLLWQEKLADKRMLVWSKAMCETLTLTCLFTYRLESPLRNFHVYVVVSRKH